MTMIEAQDILDMWDEQPPAFLSLARIEAMLEAFLGVKRRPDSIAPPPFAAAGALPAVPGLGGGGDVHAGLGTAAILDFEALRARHVK